MATAIPYSEQPCGQCGHARGKGAHLVCTHCGKNPNAMRTHTRAGYRIYLDRPVTGRREDLIHQPLAVFESSLSTRPHVTVRGMGDSVLILNATDAQEVAEALQKFVADAQVATPSADAGHVPTNQEGLEVVGDPDFDELRRMARESQQALLAAENRVKEIAGEKALAHGRLKRLQTQQDAAELEAEAAERNRDQAVACLQHLADRAGGDVS